MLLAVDIGNSNIVMGAYKEGKVCFLTRMATDHLMEPDQYAIQIRGILGLYGVARENVDKLAIASVVPSLTPVITQAFEHFTDEKPHFLSQADAPDVQVTIENPAELGIDIFASAIAVRRTRPLPAVVIDMGTATKIIALDEKGRLLGVSIAPGLFISLDALVQKASALRGVALEAPQSAIGRNTAESMKSGLLLGTAAMIDGMIDRFSREMGGLASVVATGGAAGAVIPHCRHDIHLCETLLLDGIYQVIADKTGFY